MAFLKKASASVVRPSVTMDVWGQTRPQTLTPPGVKTATAQPNLLVQAAEILGHDFDPDKYLLTHATIVCSVDTEIAPTLLGSDMMASGKRINRKYADYRITRETLDFINNNKDSWSRGVIGKSFHTFRGGQNFQEHVQILEQSKGRIIDAVARDIGPSVYVDILIATDRKHTELIRDIESGKMATLSMGCFVPGTQVTMGDGRRVAIEDVQPGDMVLTHTGKVREVQNKQIRYGDWDMRTIHAVGLSSPITSTGNHPYYVLRAAEVCACGCGEPLGAHVPSANTKHTIRRMERRFKRGHDKRVFNPKNTYSLDEYRERKQRMEEIQSPSLIKVRADDLRVGDFVAFPRIKDGVDTVDVSEARARLLGYFLAEGSFNKTRGQRKTVAFTFSEGETETFVAEVVRLLEAEFPGKNKPWVHHRDERNTCTVHLTNQEAVDWFYENGGEYSHGKRLSSDVMRWSTETHKHLIGAWINGDGTCAKNHGGFLSGVTVSLDLASQMHALMAKCGWFARFEARIGTKSVSVQEAVNGGFAVRDEVTHKLPSYTLTMGNTQSVELQGYSSKAPSTAKYSNINFRTLEDYMVSPITEIQSSSYTGVVHNMEVEEDHTYIVEGVSVSNCNVDHTTCTKCGNVAADETELCDHIRFEKGNKFFYPDGKEGIVAELCGHESIDPTGGVTFIEASWVATPAFEGAVLRNILTPVDGEKSIFAHKIQEAMLSGKNSWKGASRNDRIQKVASILAGMFDEEGDGEEDGGGDAEAKQPPDRLKDLEDALYDQMVQRVRKRVKDDLTKDEQVPADRDSLDSNNNLSHNAASKTAAQRYRDGLKVLVRNSTSDADLLNKVAQYNEAHGVIIPIRTYRLALKVGGVNVGQKVKLAAWKNRVASEIVEPSQRKNLIALCRLLDQRTAKN